ncbi:MULTISPECIES: N-acetylmuramoyl-L-alanine amidase [Allobaculum]|uniref:N-acetylmuramoyl-L-alanine amidase n=1 Tax=Allobaculum TaxID=174708 RepID=UPI001E360413|nr:MULTISPECIES: N-acetylmuramoyl-L-alanine amidase [Allobaculum]UNT92251.1 N-acetylmuramoyl-L-alanine amidase [Allobaculum sp. Allo2]
MVEITKSYIPAGTPARPAYPMDATGVTIHNTGSSASAKNHMLYMTQNGGFNSTTSYHFVIDDINCFQLLPITENAWHAGDGALGAGNRKTIAIEICECGDIKKAHDRAAELTAYLLKKIGGSAQHSVFQHAQWMAKDCPRLLRSGRPYSWSTFLEKVNQFMKTEAPASKKEPVKVPEAAAGSVYRLYSGADHLYTQSHKEAQALADLGWKYEGIGWVAPAEGEPVYRLYAGGKHLFTADQKEKNRLVDLGWKDEGTAFISGGSRPIYRMYNPHSGEHLLTASLKEHDAATKAGWYCEGQEIKY